MAANVRKRGADELSIADTIVALSSGRPPAAIAVIRVSGAGALSAATALAGTLPAARRAGLRTLRDGQGGALDRALVLVFPGPASATGEDLVELHCHGGRAVVEAVETALVACPGVRRAEPGEFTRRALAHGRIDLAEAEGLADLLAAETEGQRRAAWAAAGGVVSGARGWMDRLAVLSAEVEARIDHEDEGDVPADHGSIAAALAELRDEWRAVLAVPPVERIRDGIRVVIAGPPNAGKSTLLNALVGREVAIVTPIAGTTRDRIEAPVSRAGIAYLLIDTAGLTDTADPVEAIGVARAEAAVTEADLVLWVSDAPAPARALRVHARSDLPGRSTPVEGAIAVSARTGEGLNALWDAITARTAALLPTIDALALSRRQRALVAAAHQELDSAVCGDWLIVAEQCRRARRFLAELLGVDATESMLDALFSRFCLGK